MQKMPLNVHILLCALILFLHFPASAIAVEASETTLHEDSSHEQALIDKLIVLPTGEYDVLEAKQMTERLEQIPTEIISSLVASKVTIRFLNGPITDEPEMQRYKGVTPRGWQGSGLTWDDVPGVGSNPVLVRIGYSTTGMGHGSYNLELHETAHAIDYAVFNRISSSPAFLDLFHREAEALFGGNQYEEVYPEEYFAETTCMLFYSDKSRQRLEKFAPGTFAFLDELFRSYEHKKPQWEELNGHWAASSIERMIEIGVVRQFPDGTIRPSAVVTREQTIRMLMEALASRHLLPEKTLDRQSGQPDAIFADVPLTAWSHNYIQQAIAHHIINPAEYGERFRPGQNLTRAELAEWVAKVLELTPSENTLTFDDASDVIDKRGLIGAAVRNGVMNGMPGNRLSPEDTLTRAQACVMLDRMLDRLQPVISQPTPIMIFN
ncbi:S-layer homology domain-containing protein [Paenibacillaceae bacterium]|nr:S-layer homology domain-containing protein [Paenibacillaceae bacterium]